MVSSFSLYFHIPFCKQKCSYCHFYVIPDQDRFKNLYLNALKKEWELRSTILPKKAPISIYFGGGTPTLLEPERINSILSWLPISPDCEITLEANPENTTLEQMRAYKETGINRVSIGVQSLDDRLLSKITRQHTAEEAIRAVENTKRAGIENITIDLMYDLPTQTLKSWEATLRGVTQLPLSHLSLYNLTIEPHTPFYKRKTALSSQMPSDETSLRMLEMAIHMLEDAGWNRYEISAFCKPSYHSRHNIGYWTDRPFLGFGPSAFSYWEKSRFRNIANIHRYAKALNQGTDPTDFREKLSTERLFKERLAIGLRLLEGISIQKWPYTFPELITRLQKMNFLESKGENICLTEKGLLFHDTVAEIIMES